MPALVAFIPTPLFVKQIRKLTREFPSLQADFDALIETLKTAPATGQPLGQDCYKIRLAISSKGKGKSGGARIITCVKS